MVKQSENSSLFAGPPMWRDLIVQATELDQKSSLFLPILMDSLVVLAHLLYTQNKYEFKEIFKKTRTILKFNSHMKPLFRNKPRQRNKYYII